MKLRSRTTTPPQRISHVPGTDVGVRMAYGRDCGTSQKTRPQGFGLLYGDYTDQHPPNAQLHVSTEGMVR
ncbi:hypothetical protein [Dictyobacter arantiisoli]|uniref:Uncharacterized protein n=1 Tax=Dictyobacter arantiisoli TaxID=2014874 RepID=A0A5A5THZ2_9CHLR|nr:hypothetical protein [Dictyobacter arantiisoli]GCF10845.1 hypothetical protein KDI_44090 [Dictyobacter arantiisoli]